MNRINTFFLVAVIAILHCSVSVAQIISFDRTTTTYAGTTYGYVDGPIASAKFFGPSGISLDPSGNFYVSDNINKSIVRKINTSGTVSTVAGSGIQGFSNGPVSSANFALPNDQVVLSSGTMYIVDAGNHQIRRVSGGSVSTFVGDPAAVCGYADDWATSAKFCQPAAIISDASGNFYVTDSYNHAIRKITPGGVVTTLAGNGTAGYVDDNGTAARFNYPYGIAIDASGDLYVSEMGNHTIRKVTPTGDVTTIAGTAGVSGFKDGLAATAQFYKPLGLDVDTKGNIYVVDCNNSRIRKITPSGYVITIAGNGTGSQINGVGTLATYYIPKDIVIDAAGNAYITDLDIIRKISALPAAPNQFTTTSGYASIPQLVAISGAGLTGNMTISAPTGFEVSLSSSTGYSSALALAPVSGSVTTTQIYVRVSSSTVAGSYSDSLEINSTGATFQRLSVKATVSPNTADPTIMPAKTFSSFSGSGNTGTLDGPANVAQFSSNVSDLAMDASGIIYVADYNNHKIRKVALDGTVTTLAGSGTATFADGTGTAASFNYPTGIAVDASGIIYVADRSNHKIRKITPGGVVTTFAGSGTAGALNGVGTAAQFNNPLSIAFDALGNLYVADATNNKIRKILPDGTVSDFGGTGYNSPSGVAVDINGNVYVADYGNKKVRKITPAGVMTTLAGAGTSGTADGLPSIAQFTSLNDVAVDPSGNVYVTDGSNMNVRRITQAGVVTTIGASTNSTYGFLDGISTEALLSFPKGLANDVDGNIYLLDNLRVRKITPYSFTPFDTYVGSPSYDQKYPVIAANLGSNLIVTAPTGFEVSSNGTAYFSSVSITPTLGNVKTSIYVRISAAASVGSYQDSVVLSSTGAITIKAPVTGEVKPAQANVYFERTATLLAGSTSGYVNGNVSVATFNTPRGIAVNKQGTVYVSEVNNNLVRSISSSGNVTTFANGVFNTPAHMILDNSGNIYLTDMYTYKLFKITPAGVITTIAGSTIGYANGTGTAAQFYIPTAVAMDKAGNLYVTEEHEIRKITPTGVVTTLTGTGTGAPGYKNGKLAEATFNLPRGIVCDKDDNLYVADYGNHCIRKISKDGYVTTVAGKTSLAGAAVSGSADGTTSNASFKNPYGLAIDSNGVLYVGDYNNNKIRQIANGYVSTLAGTGTAGGTNGVALTSTFNGPNGIAFDSSGTIFICDEKNHRIRTLTLPKLTFTTTSGTASASQSFIVNGTVLQGDLTVSAPAGFEVSLSSSTGFSSSVNFTPVSGSSLNKVVYLRVSSTAPAGNYISNVTLSSTNAYSQLMPFKATVNATVKTSQTITFSLPVKTYLDPAFTISASASSGLAVTTFVSSNPAVATISGNTVTIIGAGTAIITASQAGDAFYSAAPDAARTLTVNKADQTITFGAVAPLSFAPQYYTPTASSTSGLQVTFTIADAAVATSLGTYIQKNAVGTTTITAVQAGNANYNAAVGVVQTFTIVKANQTITFTQPTTKTYDIGSFAPGASSTSGLTITYTSSNPSVATISGNTIIIVGIGTTDITASQPGNGNYNAGVDVVRTLTVTKGNQTITFATIANKAYGSGSFTLAATSSSGLTITYTSSNPSVATIAGNTVFITGVGSTTITASQGGDVNYNPALDVGRSLTVTKSSQAITFSALAGKSIGDADFTLGATASSTLTVTYTSSNPSVATVSGNIVTIIGPGSTIITASQPGNSNYNAATNVNQTLTVSKSNQTITFGSLLTKNVGDASFALNATASSSLTVTYVSSNPSVATISGNTVTIVGGGTATITASQIGNASYNAATDVAQVLTVNKLDQTITFGSLPTKNTGDASFTLNATSSSSLVVTYVSSNTSVATVSGNTVTIVGGGTATITASQSGNASYNAAPDIAQVLTVNKLDQTITFTSLPTKNVGDASFTLNATASSSLAVTYTSSNPSVATVSGNTITIVGGGTATITASQSGNASYNAAPDIAQVLTVNKLDQTITFTSLPTKNTGDGSFTLNATASSSLAVTYISSNPSVATISGNIVTIVGGGSAIITASQSGNASYNAAADVTQSLIIIVSDIIKPIITDALIYPNPAFNIINVQPLQPLSGKVSLTVLNNSGIIMYSSIEQGGVSSYQLDISDFSAGIYIVKLSNESTQYMQKIIKLQ